MLTAEQRGPVLHLTLNRPEVRNALNAQLIQELTQAFQGISGSVRAVVMRGAGASFCAGGDLQWMREAAGYTVEQNAADALKLARLFESILNSPAVTIAVVHGAAFGGGAGLTAAADVAIAEEATKFAFSEVKLGLIPATISEFVGEKIGKGNARAYYSTGEVFDAATALRIGLVHDVCQGEEALEDKLTFKLKAVLSGGPSAVAASKRIAREAPVGFEESARRLAEVRASAEGKEGVSAFLERRKAAFVVENE